MPHVEVRMLITNTYRVLMILCYADLYIPDHLIFSITLLLNPQNLWDSPIAFIWILIHYLYSFFDRTQSIHTEL